MKKNLIPICLVFLSCFFTACAAGSGGSISATPTSTATMPTSNSFDISSTDFPYPSEFNYFLERIFSPGATLEHIIIFTEKLDIDEKIEFQGYLASLDAEWEPHMESDYLQVDRSAPVTVTADKDIWLMLDPHNDGGAFVRGTDKETINAILGENEEEWPFGLSFHLYLVNAEVIFASQVQLP